MMNKMIQMLFVFLSLTIITGYANAASCDVPSFLQVDKTYRMKIGGGMGGLQPVKVLEINKKSCWIKVNAGREGVFWVNLNQVSLIGSKQ